MAEEPRGNREETRERFVRYSSTRDPAARDELVAAHLGLARHLALRFAHRGEPVDDLFQVASLGLFLAVERFDPGRGVEFSTFANQTVIGELKRHFRDKGWAVRAPRRVQELYLELGHAIGALSQELGRSPTVAELAHRTSATEEAVLEALEAGRGYRSASIDEPDRLGENLSERIQDTDEGFARAEDRSVLAEGLAHLPRRQQIIVRLRFVDGLTQSEIANRVGLSQMHVSRLLSSSLNQLRNSIQASRGGVAGPSPIPVRPPR